MNKIHLIACSRCGKIHPRGQCPVPKNPRQYNKRTGIQRFRSSALWQHKTEEIKKRDKFLCRLCLHKGYLNMRELSVHHIIPITEAEDKRLDNDNLITLCSSCHREVEGNGSYTDLLRALATLPPGLKK